MKELANKIWRRWVRLRLRPIRVFVFHHVSDERDPLVCQKEDWTQLDQFKRNIEKLRERYTFISLSEAYIKLTHDKFRLEHYAVLTTDDGLASVQNVMPWLEEKKIPLTLFVNTRYMEGDKIKPVHQKWLQTLAPDANEKEIAERMYLSKEQLWSFTSPYIEIGMHGHKHLNVQQISEAQFEADVNACREELCSHPRFIPEYAYPWGMATKESLIFLKNNRFIPVLVRGGKNYQWDGYIDRECIDNTIL